MENRQLLLRLGSPAITLCCAKGGLCAIWQMYFLNSWTGQREKIYELVNLRN